MHQHSGFINFNTAHHPIVILTLHHRLDLTRLELSPKLILYILTDTFLMMVVVNSSLKNPGPGNENVNNLNSDANYVICDKLSIYYQNVQGLIPFTELNKTHPSLDNTKLSELHAYVYDKRPDIIILNETWLKKSILDGEILPCDKYKTFRWDRTEDSHPPDPENPSRYKKNGGGVLIAVNCALKLSCNRINLKCKAELLAIEMIMNDSSKLVITTCYRVGTLGIQDCNEICSALAKLLRKKRVKKLFRIGDLNLRNINWETCTSSNNVEKIFLEEFFKLGLIQCITTPTHIKEIF